MHASVGVVVYGCVLDSLFDNFVFAFIFLLLMYCTDDSISVMFTID